MSLPTFSAQSELFSTAGLSASLFALTDRYRIFAQAVYPCLVEARETLAQCYCADNGRVAIEPVLMLGVSLLQEIDGVPDRQAVELLHYHAGWNFALNRQLGDRVFHPTGLVKFRNRLIEYKQSSVVFESVLAALQQAGLIGRQNRQRLDSTAMFGRIARMNRLDCVRETLRLALTELEAVLPAGQRPCFWIGLWERYVESQADYRASAQTLGRKLGEAGRDAWQVLEWLDQPAQREIAAGGQVALLKRVFREQFDVLAGQSAPVAREKEPVMVAGSPEALPEDGPAGAPAEPPGPALSGPAAEPGSDQSQWALQALAPVAPVVPKGKGQLDSTRVQNPHDPEATYAIKGQGRQKKEHVGFKVQVAESVSEAVLAPGEPTRNFITGMVVHPAHQSDELGAVKMEQEQARMGLEKPSVEYVDGAYISAQKLAQARAEGRELIGPAQPAPCTEGRFCVADFKVQVEERKAVCPAGKTSTQCSRLEEEATGKVHYRFEFSTHCHDCPLRAQCLGKDQRHRTLVVGEHHTLLQARRQEQQTQTFKQRMKHRNGIEGTQSELVRGHGLRQARYRGLPKVRLQGYFAGAACNVKRWINRRVWELSRAAATRIAVVT